MSDQGGPPRLAGAIVRRGTAWLVALVPILAAVAAIALLGEAEREASPTDAAPEGYGSTRAVELRSQLESDSASTAVVLFTSDDGRFSRSVVDRLTRVAGELGGVPTGPQGPVVVAADRTAALAVVPVEATSATETAELVTELRERAADLTPEGVGEQVTGPAAIQADLAAVFDGANLRLLAATATVVALLLVITYRSPVLWLIPLTVIGVADRFAAVAATQLMGLTGVAWDESTVGILSVLVFGAGTDYALLLISRYRDELRRHESRHEAMALALARTTHAVLSSATTVVVGLLTLLLSVIPTTRGLGFACAVGVVVAAFFALVVLPAAMVLLGRWVFWPKVPHVGDEALVDNERSLWHQVGRRVSAAPVASVTGVLVVLVAMSLGLLRVETGLDQADQFIEKPEAISATERLGESFPAGVADPTLVVSRADGREVRRAVAETAGVESVSVGDEGSGIVELRVVLAGTPGSAEAQDAIAGLRAGLAPFDATYVGGSEAEAVDEADATARDRLVILPLILGLVLVALVLLLRSLLAPVLLVATVVATYAAALGASWWLFTGPLGFERLDSGVPLLSFLFLVALGVDYNIFLVTRAREEASGRDTRSGMLRALTATGGVITSAGVLLAAVFAVLGVLPLVVLAQVGTVICIGVLLDTLLVRTVLVPALALLLGERFWWPGRIARRTA